MERPPASPTRCASPFADPARRARLFAPPDCAEALEEVRSREPRLHAELLGLDPHQRAAVLHGGPAQLIEAQVGSGKTTVLVLRLLWLWRVRQVPLEELAALTFTQRAAGQLRARIAALAPQGPPPEESLRLVGTFHAVARRLLLSELPLGELGYPGQGTIRLLEPAQREALWERLIETHGLRLGDRRRLARRLEAARRGQPLPAELARLRALYEAEKRARGLLDFDDLLTHATTLLRRPALPGSGSRFRAPRWVLVDELQDASPEQLDFLTALGGPRCGWTAVGDPSQSIYGWRGARPEVLQRFARERRAEVLDLPLNYRSTGAIVEGARALLETAEVTATRPAGEPLQVLAHHDPIAEAAWIVERLRALAGQGLAWEELAVLCRLHEQAEPVARALKAAAIPYHQPPQATARELPALAWLRRALLGGLAGRADLVRAALLDRRYGPLAGRRLQALERLDPHDPQLLALRAALDAALPRAHQPGRRAALRVALTWSARLGELPAWFLAHPEEPAALARTLLAHLDVPALLRPASPSFARDHQALEARLARWLTAPDQEHDQEHEQEHEQPSADVSPRLRARLEGEDWAQADPGPGAEEAPATGVTLGTLHAAKGLEWRRVFLIGLNDGVMPLGAARDPAARTEEQRLLFVGLTRARDGVELSWCRMPLVARARGAPSPFLSLLPATPTLPRPDPPASPSAAPRGLRPGQAVRHRRYGPGTVLELSELEVVCRFAQGEKRFLLAGCPLTVVPES